MDDTVSEFVSSVKSIVGKSVQQLPLLSVVDSRPPIAITGTELMPNDSRTLSIHVDMISEAIEFYQTNNFSIKVHFTFSDGTESDGIVSGPLSNMTIDYPDSDTHQFLILNYVDAGRFDVMIIEPSDLYFTNNCSAEFVPPLDSLKTTIDSKEYEVPTLNAFNEIKHGMSGLERSVEQLNTRLLDDQISGNTITPQVLEKQTLDDEKCITCVFNTFPMNARINYDIRYKFNGADITEKGYITFRDFFFQSNQPFVIFPTERTLNTELSLTLEIRINYHQSPSGTDTSKYDLDFVFNECDEIISSDIELIPPNEKQRFYSATKIDKMFSELKEMIEFYNPLSMIYH